MGPPVVGIASSNFAVEFIGLDIFAHWADIGEGVVKVRLLRVDLVHVDKKFLDSLHEVLIRRARCQDERLDHVGVHGPRRVRFHDGKPVASWEVVPWRGRVSMHSRHEERGVLRGFGCGRRRVGDLSLAARCGSAADCCPELLDKAGVKVSLLLPKRQQILDLPHVLGRVRERRGAPNKGRQGRRQGRGEPLDRRRRPVANPELEVV